MAQYQDGDTRTINGVTYVRTNGAWMPHVGSQFANPTLQYEGPKAAAETAKAQADVANIPEEREKLHEANIAAQRENMQFVGDATKHGKDYIASIPAEFANYRNIIPMIAHNQVQVGNVARSNNEAKLLIAGAKQYDPHYDPSLATIRAKALQDYTGSGDASQRIQALDRAANALSLLKEYSDQMGGPNTGYSPLNSLIAGNQQDTGARLIAAKKFDSLLPEAMGQLNTVLAGSTTVSGMKEIKEGLDPHASQEERNAAFEAYAHALVNAGNDLKQGWNSAYGGTAAPPVWISPQNAAFLEKMTGAKSGSLGENDFRGLPGLNPDGSYAPPRPNVTQQPTINPNDFQLSAGAPTASTVDPVLKAATQRVGAMIADGTPDATILKTVQDMGVDPAKTNVPQILQYRQSPDFTNWQNAHLGQPYPVDPRSFMRDTPVSAARQLFNKTASTDLGGDVAAGIVATGNAVAGNRGAQLVGAINGDPEMAQTGMQLLRTQHPYSSLAGDVAGNLIFDRTLGMVPGAQGLMASAWGRRGADALYGAYYGSGDNGGVGGGVEGAVGNAVGGMFGRGAQAAVGRTLSGVKNGALQLLDNAGVPLTIGQIGRGSNNMFGHVVGGVEERLSGLPGFDALIGGARKRGDEGFNRAAFAEAGVQNDQTGAAGLDAVNTLKNNAYGFIKPLNLPVDATFAGMNAGIRAGVPGMPGFGNEVGKTLDQIDRISGPNGGIAGQDWQSALSSVRANRASIKGAPFSNEATNALGDIDQNLMGLAARQGPPGTVDQLNAANRLNAQANTLQAALDNGPAQQAGQLFSPLRLDNASRINTRNYGGRLASLTGQNRPFYDLTQAGLQVMPNLTKDSGTAGRFWLVPLLSSAVGGGIGALTGGEGEKGEDAGLGASYGGLLAASALPYSKVGQRAIQKAMLGDRSPVVQRIGQYLINNTMPAGMFGSGLTRDYLFGQTLPPQAGY